MSGGHWNYEDRHLKNDIFGYADTPWNALEDIEISELVFDVLDLLHDYDWYISGDTDKEDYLKSKWEFKSKWLKNDEERTKRIIDKAKQDLMDELYTTFNFK